MRAHYKRNLFDSQPLDFTNVAKFVPPEIRHLNRQTDGHKSRFRLYIDRGERLVRVVVKNSVLPRWRSAATNDDLDKIVSDIYREFPNCGIRRMKRFLTAKGINVQWERVRSSLWRVDPERV